MCPLSVHKCLSQLLFMITQTRSNQISITKWMKNWGQWNNIQPLKWANYWYRHQHEWREKAKASDFGMQYLKIPIDNKINLFGFFLEILRYLIYIFHLYILQSARPTPLALTLSRHNWSGTRWLLLVFPRHRLLHKLTMASSIFRLFSGFHFYCLGS